MPCEVRSPGQVKWPNYKITFQSRHGYNVSGKVMKLSEYDEVISAYKTYISDFWYRWPQVRSFLRPPHYKSMGKKSTLLYLLWRKRFWVESYRIGQLWTIREKNCITYPSKGHLRSPEVTNRHLPIIFDQKEIETWMQYDPFWSSRDLGLTWPEVKLWPWPFKFILYMVRRALTRQTRWYQIRRSIFKKKIYCRKTVLENFGILTPGDPNFDLSQKMTEMISKLFFASFRTLPFVFLYGDQEPRSWGGRSNAPPPPQQAVGNPEAQQGAG